MPGRYCRTCGKVPALGHKANTETLFACRPYDTRLKSMISVKEAAALPGSKAANGLAAPRRGTSAELL